MMVKVKPYFLFCLIVFLGLLTLTGCGGGKSYDFIDDVDGHYSWYSGEVKNGKPHGQGTLYKEGDTYKGEFKNGKPTGNGIWTYAESKPSPTQSSGKSSASCGHASCAEEGPFLCMGKNDTCTNTTGCAYVFYCSSCR